jgi:hypothetical protein
MSLVQCEMPNFETLDHKKDGTLCNTKISLQCNDCEKDLYFLESRMRREECRAYDTEQRFSNRKRRMQKTRQEGFGLFACVIIA